jgi:hypothetical protein
MVIDKRCMRVWSWVLCWDVLRETEKSAVSVRASCSCCAGMFLGRQKCLLWVCKCGCEYCAGVCLGRQCLLWVCECGCEYCAGICLGRQKSLQCIRTTLKTLSLLCHQQIKLQSLFGVWHSLFSFLCHIVLVNCQSYSTDISAYDTMWLSTQL